MRLQVREHVPKKHGLIASVGRRLPEAALLGFIALCGSQLKAQLPGGDEKVLFDSPPAVETAALYTQTLQEAPANVTVVSRQEIRKYGFRTLAEALSNVRGFFTSYDGGLYYAGVRGFALPGDYNTRILVMINGHYMTDNVYGAMYMFGQDFGLDMDLVDRIEIVRGPSSALYGSNGMFATINIFTRAPADSPRAYVTTEIGSFGERKTMVAGSVYLGRGANLLLSGSGFYTRGRSMEFDGRRTDRLGAEQGYHTFAQLTWRNWSVTANFQDRKVIVPTGWYGSDFGATGTSSRDAHDYVDAVYIKPIGNNSQLRWRLAYDRYTYYGRYISTVDGVWQDDRDLARGDWLSSRLTYRKGMGANATLAVGGEVSVDLRAVQQTEFVAPTAERTRDEHYPDRSYGVFVQQSWTAGKNWTLYGGLRLDDAANNDAFLAPRLAAVWQATPSTAYKFSYGRSFRNPSFFEQSWIPNPLLRAETMNTFEATREQRLGRSVNLTGSAFWYRVGGLIEGVPVNEDGDLQYRNVDSSEASGLEVEASGEPWDAFELSGSLGLSRARFRQPAERMPNSPARVAQVRASVPLARRRLTIAGAARYVSARLSPFGFEVPGGAVLDLTATTHKLARSFDLQFGIRNLTDRRYADPLSVEHLTQTIPRPGRAIFLKLIWRHGE